MAKLNQADLQRFALAGAARRLEELQAEAAQILRVFPQLRAGGRGRQAGNAAAAKGPAGPRRRHRISAEGRKRISEAAKARWGKHRREAGKSSKRAS